MRRRVVYFYRQDCLVCNTTYRDLTMSGADMQIARVCVDEHPLLKNKQSVPALFVSDTKAMHVGSSSIMEYVRSALIDAQMAQMRNDAAQKMSGAGIEGNNMQLQQQQHQHQQQQQHNLTRGGGGAGIGSVIPPDRLKEDDGPSAADWNPGDGQAFSWISGDGGSRMRMGIEYDDASVWSAAPSPASTADSDVPGRGRSATGIGAPPSTVDRMMPPQINNHNNNNSSALSIELIEQLRKQEEGAWKSAQR